MNLLRFPANEKILNRATHLHQEIYSIINMTGKKSVLRTIPFFYVRYPFVAMEGNQNAMNHCIVLSKNILPLILKDCRELYYEDVPD